VDFTENHNQSNDFYNYLLKRYQKVLKAQVPSDLFAKLSIDSIFGLTLQIIVGGKELQMHVEKLW
jgi:hypothetical protein